MKKEDLVCDIEYAKKLAELGVNIDSIYSFTQYSIKSDKNYKWNIILTNVLEKYIGIKTFTTDELLEMLPDSIFDIKNNNTYEIEISKRNNKYFVFYDTTEEVENWSTDYYNLFEDKKLSNSLAKLLIWCIENRYMEVK